jgi:hypothetical protein
MQIATAIKQIQKEAEKLGLSFAETMQEIQREGAQSYSNSIMEAYLVIRKANMTASA